MKRAARTVAKPKKKSPAVGTVAREPARPRQNVVREIGSADAERRDNARVIALEIENAKLNSMVGQFEQILHTYVSAFEKLSADNNRSQEAVKALQQEVSQKTQELQRNLIEKEAVRTFLSTILESLPNGVITTDLAGSITGANRTAKDILGQEGSALLGENINVAMGKNIVPPSEVLDPMAEPVSFSRQDGESYKLQVSVTQMKDADHQTGFVVNLQDVTLLKKLEEQSARRNRFTVMGEMAANIAHEIRNPLGSIELFASLVRKGLPEEDEKTGLMNRISSAITSMNHIISNVLEYTKPRAVTLKEMDLHTLLRELEGFFSFQCEQNGVTLTLSLEAPDTWIRADREMLKQVFHNLLLNAVQAMPEGGTLTLATRTRAVSNVDLLNRLGRAPGPDGGILNVLEVTVRDAGVGMPPEIQNRIFDPFFTTKSRGTGLGLAITHSIIEAHQATIDVDSRAGQGTAFVLMFPLLRG